MPDPLSGRTLEVLEFIGRYTEKHGMPPTLKEIADQFSITPPSAFAHVKRLDEEGYIKRRPRRRRSIRVIEAARSLAVPVRQFLEVPVVGRVAAGDPIIADEHREGTLSIDPSLARGGGTIFALKVSGDSMIDADIREGDHLIVRQQPVADNGDIVVAIIGNEGTVKRLRMSDQQVELVPENSRYEPIRIEKGDEFRVVGKALAVYRIAKEKESELQTPA